MIIQSKYTKIFKSKDLTRQKYDELHNFAVLIQNHKNTVSQYVNDNLLHFLEYNKFQFLKEMREVYFEPKKLKREKVKEVLLSFRRSLQNVGSECTNCSLAMFNSSELEETY